MAVEQATIDINAVQRGIIRDLEKRYGFGDSNHQMIGRRLALVELGVISVNECVFSLREQVKSLAHQLSVTPDDNDAEHRIQRKYLRTTLDLYNNCILDILTVKTLTETPAHP